MNPLLAALVQAGLMPQQDADLLARQLDSNLAREYAEQQMLLSFQAGLASQRDRLLDIIRANDGVLSMTQQNRFWAGENELLWGSVRDTILDVASERAVIASIDAGGADTWNLINDAVIDWAEDYYVSADADDFGSIPNLNVTSRTEFQKRFVEWQRGELTVFGRTATGELRQGLDALIVALEPTFGASRARAIAVTETTRIFTESIRAAESANPFTTQWEWLTAEDEMVCSLCGPRAGTRVGKNAEGFDAETDDLVVYPPIHPFCRCQIIALTEESARVSVNG